MVSSIITTKAMIAAFIRTGMDLLRVLPPWDADERLRPLDPDRDLEPEDLPERRFMPLPPEVPDAGSPVMTALRCCLE
ncbi:hypothetical protein [Croceibacterium xixiisoli]|uniref:hypothetical protein n=1 Tax=Croceibacterium xixiisoli TaxID=1476466 RepID=UPI00136AD1AB|nr:hypothetical protein [Croceibacterium xixiisoli]